MNDGRARPIVSNHRHGPQRTRELAMRNRRIGSNASSHSAYSGFSLQSGCSSASNSYKRPRVRFSTPLDAPELSKFASKIGYLRKQADNEPGAWNTYYFLIKPTTYLYYYNTAHDELPRGVIDLEYLTDIRYNHECVQRSVGGSDHAFRVTGQLPKEQQEKLEKSKLRPLFFDAESPEEAQNWMEAIRQHRYNPATETKKQLLREKLEKTMAKMQDMEVEFKGIATRAEHTRRKGWKLLQHVRGNDHVVDDDDERDERTSEAEDPEMDVFHILNKIERLFERIVAEAELKDQQITRMRRHEDDLEQQLRSQERTVDQDRQRLERRQRDLEQDFERRQYDLERDFEQRQYNLEQRLRAQERAFDQERQRMERRERELQTDLKRMQTELKHMACGMISTHSIGRSEIDDRHRYGATLERSYSSSSSHGEEQGQYRYVAPMQTLNEQPAAPKTKANVIKNDMRDMLQKKKTSMNMFLNKAKKNKPKEPEREPTTPWDDPADPRHDTSYEHERFAPSPVRNPTNPSTVGAMNAMKSQLRKTPSLQTKERNLSSASDETMSTSTGRSSGAAPVAAVSMKKDEPLPRGWSKRESRNHPGEFYYVNDFTGFSSWEVPTEDAKEHDDDESEGDEEDHAVNQYQGNKLQRFKEDYHENKLQRFKETHQENKLQRSKNTFQDHHKADKFNKFERHEENKFQGHRNENPQNRHKDTFRGYEDDTFESPRRNKAEKFQDTRSNKVQERKKFSDYEADKFQDRNKFQNYKADNFQEGNKFQDHKSGRFQEHKSYRKDSFRDRQEEELDEPDDEFDDDDGYDDDDYDDDLDDEYDDPHDSSAGANREEDGADDGKKPKKKGWRGKFLKKLPKKKFNRPKFRLPKKKKKTPNPGPTPPPPPFHVREIDEHHHEF